MSETDVATTEIGSSSESMSFGELVFSDLAALRPGTRPGWLGVLLRLPFEPGILASLLLRTQQCLHRSGHGMAARALRTLGNVLIGVDFGAGMTVGKGFMMVHPVGVTMGFGARIGDNVRFASGVTLAGKYYEVEEGRDQEFPVIEDDVTVGAHAVIVGGVRIGRNAMVGANSVVLSDVAPDTVVLGNPARRVAKRSDPAVIELVERAAAADPGRPAVVTHEATVTYGELRAMSYAAAAGLAGRGWRRVATVEPDAATVIALLAGASAVGAEICQYPPAEPDDVPGLAERFDHTVLLCADAGLGAGAASVVPPSELLADRAAASASERRVETSAGVRPHLVLTTGTTGAPRGVRHDWSRLLRGVARVQPAPDERWLLAYGLHQFAGLQILLHVLAAGATLVAPWPRRPQEGLIAMRALGVTHASATPTYWRFLLAEMRSDGGRVPDLRQLTLGGEAIPGPLLERLRATFPGARVSQIYAATEFGSTGSVRDGRAGLSADVLRRGNDADVAMRIVDGELWVRSRTGMLGYYGEPPVDPDAWRPTGDLVEEVDGRIEFRGRASEVINVGGVKVHPLPVEERIGAVPGVAIARVWGRPSAMTGSIVAVDVVPVDGVDPADLKAAVKESCADLPGAARPRSIRIVEEITMQGNKIVRQA